MSPAFFIVESLIYPSTSEVIVLDITFAIPLRPIPAIPAENNAFVELTTESALIFIAPVVYIVELLIYALLLLSNLLRIA